MFASTVVDFASLHTDRLCDSLRAGLFKKNLSCFKKNNQQTEKNPINEVGLLPYNSRVGVGAEIFPGIQAGREDHGRRISEMIEHDHKYKNHHLCGCRLYFINNFFLKLCFLDWYCLSFQYPEYFIKLWGEAS